MNEAELTQRNDPIIPPCEFWVTANLEGSHSKSPRWFPVIRQTAQQISPRDQRVFHCTDQPRKVDRKKLMARISGSNAFCHAEWVADLIESGQVPYLTNPSQH